MKTTQTTYFGRALLAFAGVSLTTVCLTAHAQRVPVGTNQIALADFDFAIPSWDYGYWYSGPTQVDPPGGYWQNRYYQDPFIELEKGPGVFQFNFDSTVYQGTEAATTGWWGTGFGMPVPWDNDPMLFNSIDPADYLLSFDARVEGLVPDQATANCVMEFRLGTGGGSGWVMVKQLPYSPGSNWTHFVFNLDQGSWIGADSTPSTSLEMFTNAVLANTITTVQFNQNQPNPSQFGFDWENGIYMDNIKLEVLQYDAPPPPPPPKTAFAVLNYNFDDLDTWWAWPSFPETTSGWSANANRATYWALRPDTGAGVGGSNGFSICMDNSTILTDPPGTPAWAGGNASTGGAGDYSLLTSADLKDYRYNFKARAEGLAEAQETTTVIVQMSFNAPDDTLQPPDADTNRDLLVRLNLTVSGVSSNWQTFVLSLKDASVDAGSMANFQAHHAKVDEIQWQLQIQNPHQANIWGTDANNKIVVDDFKFERLVTGLSPLTVGQEGADIVIRWDPPTTGTVKLLSGDTPSNVNTEVPGSPNPYRTPATGGPKYFRTLWVAPTN